VAEKDVKSISAETMQKILQEKKVKLRHTKTWTECNDPQIAAKKVLRYCQKNNIHLIWTPTNASWLNPIECQITHVKDFVIRGTNYKNLMNLTPH